MLTITNRKNPKSSLNQLIMTELKYFPLRLISYTYSKKQLTAYGDIYYTNDMGQYCIQQTKRFSYTLQTGERTKLTEKMKPAG